MNRLTDGTQYRNTPAGVIAIRGKRELHLLGTSVSATAKARELLATRSFDALYKAGRASRGVRNSRYIKIHS